jgi:hypothetical protein
MCVMRWYRSKTILLAAWGTWVRRLQLGLPHVYGDRLDAGPMRVSRAREVVK